MYLQKVNVKNIRSISELEWEITKGREPGWHVIIGDNGAGKSTFLRSVALGLVGATEAVALRQDWNNWLNRNSDAGSVSLRVLANAQVDELPDSTTEKKGGKIKIFLSYAREDRDRVEKLYLSLSEAGYSPWMDVKELHPGQEWEPAIYKSMHESDFFLVCLSKKSASKMNFLQREIKTALLIWQEKVERDTYLIPARLEDCEVPDSLNTFQWANIFERDGWDHLIKAIHTLQSKKGRVNHNKDHSFETKLNFTRTGNETKLFREPDTFSFGQFLSPSRKGWFSASYGPFRRFSGGDEVYERIFCSNPRLAAHLSVFGEKIALTECVRWLQDLQFKKLEKPRNKNILDSIIDFVNHGEVLPHNVVLKAVSSEGIVFRDGSGCAIPIEELSDGYRSILSLTFELIRQLSLVYNINQIFDPEIPSQIIAQGVVLIDEIDAHLHPTWQRRIGLWFREHFPNIQFIVTTHSPLVCQAAEHGTVFRLPAPGSETQARMIEGDELNQLLYGDVLDAYGTELFGEDITRSDAGQQKLERLARLNQKGLRSTLTANERAEQIELRKVLSMASHTLEAGR